MTLSKSLYSIKLLSLDIGEQETIFIPKNTYHRLIKGIGDLDLRILEF